MDSGINDRGPVSDEPRKVGKSLGKKEPISKP